MALSPISTVASGTLFELAAAKINLSLRVLGRRSDRYHAIDSIVCFAEIGDRLTLTPGNVFTLDVTGPFAGAIGNVPTDNLVTKAVALVSRSQRDVASGAVRLEKNLPVAAGVGGGSADAAAMLRLLMRANPHIADAVDWMATAASLGADVPVCLRSTVCRMSGIGEIVESLPPLPPTFAVLANPGVPLATAAVFQALAAPPLPSIPSHQDRLDRFGSFDALIDCLQAGTNDLEAPALKICPPIASVLQTLRRLDGVRLVRMSGSGPTCFALFAEEHQARAAADALEAENPAWWIAATRLR